MDTQEEFTKLLKRLAHLKTDPIDKQKDEDRINELIHKLFYELTVPDILYKYCTYSEFTWENLRENQIYLSKLNELNDIYEGRQIIKSRADIPTNDFLDLLIEKKNILMAANDGRYASLRQAEEENKMDKQIQILNSVPSSEAMDSLACKREKENSDHMVVSCFTPDYTSVSMWERYADKHNGICIQYDFSEWKTAYLEKDLPNKEIMLMLPVLYMNNFNDYYFAEINFARRLAAGVLKTEDWSGEKEWRMLRMSLQQNKAEVLPSQIIKLADYPVKVSAIYIGLKANLARVKQITDNVKHLEIPVYQMNLTASGLKPVLLPT